MALAMSRQNITRFALPDKPAVQSELLALRYDLTSRFYKGACLDRAPEINTYQDLLVKFGDLSSVANPLETIRNVYRSELHRVLDLTRSGHNPALVSEQISNVRQATLATAFRLAVQETSGDLALAIGGSAVNGVHSFLTDIDFVVLPHSPEDREAARNVQNKMIGLLESLGIESDGNLPSLFGYRTLPELKKKYGALTGPETRAEAAVDFAFQSSYPFFLFLMDLRILDVSDAKGTGLKSIFNKGLEDLRDSLAFSFPDHIEFVARESYKDTELRGPSLKDLRAIDLKKSALRLFHFSLYAARARYGIKASDFWHIIKELEAKGAMQEQEAAAAEKALRFMIRLRHLAGYALTDTFDSAILSDQTLNRLSHVMAKSREELNADISAARDTLLSLARTLLVTSPAAK